MARYLTVDGGTTNTRVHLVSDGQVKDTEKLRIGAGNGMDGQATLREALRNAIADILRRNALSEQDITKILASGMITSELGLCPLPHLPLPAGRAELHAGMHETVFSDITAIPFVFIRGVASKGEFLEDADVMRGEETELMGILQTNSDGVLYVLPGSHSKLISMDAAGRITKFRTMLSGELFAAVVQHTILRDAVDFSITECDLDALERGYTYCCEHGVNESLFKVRILRNLFGASRQTCFGFLRGVILCDEIREIIKAKEQTVVLGGQKQFREAMAVLLQSHSKKTVLCLDDATVESSTARGAVKIFEMN